MVGRSASQESFPPNFPAHAQPKPIFYFSIFPCLVVEPWIALQAWKISASARHVDRTVKWWPEDRNETPWQFYWCSQTPKVDEEARYIHNEEYPCSASQLDPRWRGNDREFSLLPAIANCLDIIFSRKEPINWHSIARFLHWCIPLGMCSFSSTHEDQPYPTSYIFIRRVYILLLFASGDV
jgi:hypothetical protein